MLNMSQQNDIMNKTIIHDEGDKLVSAKMEIELLRELNQELKSKNMLLSELLEYNKAEIIKSKSYADTLRTNKNEKLSDNIPNIVIKAINRESAKSCEQTFKKNISANTSAQIKNVLTTKTGTVIVKCKNKEDVSRTKSILLEKLGENYEVDQDKMNLPKIKIFDIDNDMDKDELIEDICNRNSVMFDGNFKIVADFTSGNKKRSLILEVSTNIYLNVMSAGVIYVGHKNINDVDEFSELFLTNLLDMNFLLMFNNITRPSENGGSCIDNMF
ncbi:GSCOCG00012437001-RA-CDS, partial [Cotesia congregata]